MKKKAMKKRFYSLLLSLVMLLTTVPVMAEENEGTDNTPPVIEEIVLFEENGQTIQQDAELHLTIKMYDESEFSLDNTYLHIGRKEDETVYVNHAKSIEKIEGEENQYKITFYAIPENAGHECFISELTVTDIAGNTATEEFEVTKYTYTVAEPEKAEATVKSITFSETDVKLTDAVTEAEIEITAELEGDTTELYDIWLEFTDPEGVEYVLSTPNRENEDSSIYKENLTLNYGYREGTYTLKRIMNSSRAEIPYNGQMPSFTLSKENTDKTPPVVDMTSLTVKKDGVELTNGTKLDKSDSLEISVKVSDAHAMKNPRVMILTDLENIANPVHSPELIYDENSKCYTATVALTDFYATEWYIQAVTVEDIYGNHDYCMVENGISFYVTEEDGSCSIPTYTYDVRCYIGNETKTYSVTTGRVTTLKEMFKDGLPAVPQKEGYTHLGWYRYSDKTIYDEDDTIIVDGYTVELFPAYDIVDVNIHINYYGETAYGQKSITKTVTSGTTYKEVYDSINFSEFVHNSQVNFEGWKCSNSDSEEAIIVDSHMYIDALYDKGVANILVDYYDENNKHYQMLLIETQLFDKGLTYGEVGEKMTPPEVKHSESMKFVKWEITNYYLQNYPDEVFLWDTILYKAIYENAAPSSPNKPAPSPAPDYSWNQGTQEEVTETATQPTAKPQQTQEEAEDVQVEDVKQAVKLEETVIEAEVEKITQAAEGEEIVISMTKEDGSVATEIPVAVLEAAKGKDTDIVLDMGGYSWTINGKDILASDLQAINLEVTLDTEAVAPGVVNALAGGEPTRQLSLTHNGDFGFKAKLSINVGSEYAGQFGNLYYYDSNNKLVFMNAGEVQADGSVSLDFSHASDYVVVVGRDRTEEETSIVEDTEVEGTETEHMSEEVPVKEAGNTGIIVGVIVALIAVIAAVFVLKKKNHK